MNPRFDIETLSWRAGEVARMVPAGQLFGWLARTLPVPAGWAAWVLRAGLDPLLVMAGQALTRKAKEPLEHVLFVRTTPLECPLEQADVQSADGYACHGSIKVPLRVVLDHAELAAMRRTLLGAVDYLAMAGLQRYLQWPLRQVLVDLAAKHTAEELLKPADPAEVQKLIDEKLGPLCLAAGLKADGPAQVQFDSPAFRERAREQADVDRQRQHVAARTQIQEALASAQRQRLSHLAALLERMRELSGRFETASMRELLARFDESERGEMYAALWRLAAGQRARYAAVVSGQELLLFAPDGWERPARRIRLPDTLGALRSVSSDARSREAGVVLVGAAAGVYVVALETGRVLQTLAGDLGEPDLLRGGFNAAAMGDERIFATHSELGLLAWPRHDGDSPTPLCADVTRKAQAIRAARVAGDALWFTADQTVWRVDLGRHIVVADRSAPVAYRGSEAPLTALAVADDAVYAGNASGQVLAWATGEPDGFRVIREAVGNPVESVQVLETAGIRQLVLADRSQGITVLVVGDHYARRYESSLRIRRASAAHDLFLGMNENRDRLLAWRPGQPAEPAASVIIPHLTGSSIQDICLITA